MAPITPGSSVVPGRAFVLKFTFSAFLKDKLHSHTIQKKPINQPLLKIACYQQPIDIQFFKIRG